MEEKDNRLIKYAGWAFFGVMLANTLVRIMVYAFFSDMSDNGLDLMFTLLTQIVCMGVIPAVLYSRAFEDKSLSSVLKQCGYRNLNLPPKIWILTIILGVLLWYANYGAAIATNVIIAIFGYTLPDSSSTIMSNGWELLLWIVMTGIMPAIFEEFTHRGVLLSAYRGVNGRFAVVVSAIMFGLMHQNIVQVFYAIIAGLIMGYLTLYTKSIFPAMLIHFTNNTLGTILSYSSQHGGGFYALFDRLVMENLLNNTFTMLAIFGVVYIVIYFIISRVVKPLSATYCFDEDGKRQPAIDVTEHIKLEPKQKYLTVESTIKLNLPMLLAICLGVLTTLYSFIWGLMR